MKLEPGDRIQLSDGHTYLFLFPLPLDNKEYLMFSCKENDEAFRLGKITQKDGKETITFVYDKKLLKEANAYIKNHQNEI